MRVTAHESTRLDISFESHIQRNKLFRFMKKKAIKSLQGFNSNSTDFRLIAFFNPKEAKKIIKFINNQ